MTPQQLEDFFTDACVTWNVPETRIPQLRESWGKRFEDLDHVAFTVAMQRAEEHHTRYLPTIPQILALYRDVDKQANNRAKSNALLADRAASPDRDLTAAECDEWHREFTRLAHENTIDHRFGPAHWLTKQHHRFAAYYAAQRDRRRAGQHQQPMHEWLGLDAPTNPTTEILASVGALGNGDPAREAARAASLRADAEADSW